MRPPVVLPQAIASVRAQTVTDFALFVICDAAPQETVDCAQGFARLDARIHVRSFPKGSRDGEGHRHSILADANATYVAYLEDDDLWFPNHLEELEKVLQTAHFGNTIHVTAGPDERIVALPSDLGIPQFRQRSLDDIFNRCGLSFCGHRLEAYRRLPEGWAPSPVGIYADLHMWRKFFRTPEFEFGTGKVITAIALPEHLREHMSPEDRATESRMWLARVLDAEGRARIAEGAVSSLLEQAVAQEQLAWQFIALYRDALAAVTHLEEAYPGSLERFGDAITARVNAHVDLERVTVAYELCRSSLSIMTARAEAQFAEMSSALAAQRALYDRILRSRSWRLTQPLRLVMAAARRLGRALGLRLE
ncbi:MAG: hypothetical protein QOF71_3612 [Candidatus Eremiobacteraeota bacterium]|nr:hypothetical protein [Candidatus Eremiobacteraeota bacterium]